MILSTHGIVGSQIQSFVGLLDTYPNAAAAYSVRKLRTAYTGNAIRVRRSSDNTEQDIGLTALGNLDSSSLTSFCSGTNGFVTTWYDQSGNGRNATQTTAANQPQIVSSGAILTEGGKPTLKFDGTNDLLTNTTALSYTDFCLFFVFKFNAYNTSSYQCPIQYSKLDIAQVLTVFQSSDTGLATIASYNIADVGLTRRLHTAVSTISSGITTSTLFLNATQKATANRTLLTTKNTIAIGATDTNGIPSDTFQQEIVLYASSQSANQTAIQNNVNTYYAIY